MSREDENLVVATRGSTLEWPLRIERESGAPYSLVDATEIEVKLPKEAGFILKNFAAGVDVVSAEAGQILLTVPDTEVALMKLQPGLQDFDARITLASGKKVVVKFSRKLLVQGSSF